MSEKWTAYRVFKFSHFRVRHHCARRNEILASGGHEDELLSTPNNFQWNAVHRRAAKRISQRVRHVMAENADHVPKLDVLRPSQKLESSEPEMRTGEECFTCKDT